MLAKADVISKVAGNFRGWENSAEKYDKAFHKRENSYGHVEAVYSLYAYIFASLPVSNRSPGRFSFVGFSPLYPLTVKRTVKPSRILSKQMKPGHMMPDFGGHLSLRIETRSLELLTLAYIPRKP